jgi:hypothetical protein
VAVGLFARKRKRPGSLPALPFLGLAAVPSPTRHAELEPGLSGLDCVGAVLEARAAGFTVREHLADKLDYGFFCGVSSTSATAVTPCLERR